MRRDREGDEWGGMGKWRVRRDREGEGWGGIGKGGEG